MLRRKISRDLAALAGLCASLLVGAEAHAATVDPVSIPEMGCDLLVSGQIADGDAAALRLALQASDREIAERTGSPILDVPMVGMRPADRRRVCFDSPGGSFLEGLRMAELLIEFRKGAAVGDGMVCESACSLAFMGGSAAVSQVEGSDDTDRILHPRGLVGFHAPALVVPNGQYDERTVSQAYGVALAALRALSETRNTVVRGYVPGTDQATAFRYQFPESLLLQMLATPPDDMHHVQTVGEATRWDIRVGPVRFPASTASFERFAAACDNIASYWAETTEFSFDTPPFLEAQRGLLVYFEAQAARQLSAYGGLSEPAPWGGIRSDNGLRLIADVGEYWHECDVEIFAPEPGLQDPFIPVGGVVFGPRRYFYPYQLFDPATDITTLAPPAGQTFDPGPITSSLSAEIAALTARSVQSCWLTTPLSRVTNVTDYVNLRRQPDFSSPAVRQVPRGEQVRPTRFDNVTITGAQRVYDLCVSACQSFGRNPQDRQAAEQVQQCIDDNLLWYEITDARGNRGWVSRRFLEEW